VTSKPPKSDSFREDLVALVALLLLPTILFFDVLFLDNTIYRRDLTRFFFPMKYALRELLLRGEFPSWNPYVAGGQPFAANPEYQLFYPPQLLILLPDYVRAFGWHILLHVHLCLAGMYCFLRSLSLRRPSAFFGAVAFGLGNFVLSYTDIPPFFFTLAWLPLVLLFARRYFLDPGAGTFAAAALVFGIQVISGEPTTLMQTAALVACMAFYLAWQQGDNRPRAMLRAGLFGLMMGLGGALVGSVQLLPAIDHLGDSVRVRGLPFEVVRTWSMPPVRVLELLFPNILGGDFDAGSLYWGGLLYPANQGPYLAGLYIGTLTCVVFLAGLVTRQRGWLATSVLTLSAFVLTFGDHTPLLRWLYDAGLFRSFRYPEKFVILAAVPIIVFAAYTLDRILGGDRRAGRAAIAVASAVAVLSTAAALAQMTSFGERIFGRLWQLPVDVLSQAAAMSRQHWLTAAAMAGLCALLLVLFLKKPSPMTVGALLAFAAIDLGGRNENVVPRIHQSFWTRPEILSRLPERRNFRLFHQTDFLASEFLMPIDRGPLPQVFNREGLFPRVPTEFGVQTILEHDYDVTNLIPTARFMGAAVMAAEANGGLPPPSVLDRCNVQFEIRRRSGSAGAAPIRGTTLELVERSSAPRFYFASELRSIRTVTDFASALGESGIPASVTYVGFPSFRPAPGEVLEAAETSNRIRLRVRSLGAGFLVITTTPHEYWRATVDGRSMPIATANVGFMGIGVPSGEHQVELIYRNPLILIGGLLSAGSILVLAALLLFGSRRRSRRRAPDR
jgi:hypothetical protein